MIELVIFDCDGVLVDSERIASRLLAEAATRLGWPVALLDAPRVFPKGGVLADAVAQIERTLGRAVPDDFVASFRAELYQALRQELQPVPGIVAALDAISLPTCVASNGPREKIHTSLTTTRLLARFEGRIFTAYELARPKPFPDLYLHAARTLSADPARCVVVEDSVSGVQAGIAAGMRVLGFAPTAEDTTSLTAAGAATFADMSELPGLLRLP